jgi:predicted membrane-bound spermidine synthase
MLDALPAVRTRESAILADATLLVSFFISGASALIYQVCWQRSLYGLVGVDMDSITIVVSAFMLGIGIGGMLGGWLADRWPARRLTIFAAAELTIALYGAATTVMLPWMDGAMVGPAWGSAAARALTCFGFLMVPTCLMGMTLPVLTMAFNERRTNIGVSVGTLYFVNTMGAALGAIAVPTVLLPVLALSQAILLAVAGNVAVAASALAAASLLARSRRIA